MTIAYTSTAAVDLTQEQLAALLIRARERNERLTITGALLFRNGRFIQIIEGPEDAVRAVYASILADPRHRDIHLVSAEQIDARRFPGWTMGYRSLDDLLLGETPGPENSGAHAQHSPDDIRPPRSLLDWMKDYWLTPAHPAAPLAVTAAGTSGTPDHLRGGAEGQATKPAGGASPVVAAIFDKIMADVDSGALSPGDILRDSSIAELLGTSRTPVREALQKLRTIGVVESSANRFTRIAIVSPEKAAQSITVLAALYAAVLDEVIGHVDERVIEAMRRDHAVFVDRAAAGNPMAIAISGVAFYMRLVRESRNSRLQTSINAVVNVVKLAGAHLDQLIGIDVICSSQKVLLAATIAGDLAEAQRALQMLTGSVRAGL